MGGNVAEISKEEKNEKEEMENDEKSRDASEESAANEAVHGPVECVEVSEERDAIAEDDQSGGICEWVQQHSAYLEAPNTERDIDVIRDFVDGIAKRPKAIHISPPSVRMEML